MHHRISFVATTPRHSVLSVCSRWHRLANTFYDFREYERATWASPYRLDVTPSHPRMDIAYMHVCDANTKIYTNSWWTMRSTHSHTDSTPAMGKVVDKFHFGAQPFSYRRRFSQNFRVFILNVFVVCCKVDDEHGMVANRLPLLPILATFLLDTFSVCSKCQSDLKRWQNDTWLEHRLHWKYIVWSGKEGADCLPPMLSDVCVCVAYEIGIWTERWLFIFQILIVSMLLMPAEKFLINCHSTVDSLTSLRTYMCRKCHHRYRAHCTDTSNSLTISTQNRTDHSYDQSQRYGAVHDFNFGHWF